MYNQPFIGGHVASIRKDLGRGKTNRGFL